jgi:AraC-like DNA-binding protein
MPSIIILMAKLEDILDKGLFPALEKIRQEKVIWGQRSHPQRIERIIPPPDYVRSYTRIHEVPEFCVCVQGKCALCLGEHLYQLEPYDLAIINRNVRHYESFVNPRQKYEIIWFIFAKLAKLIILHSRYDGETYQRLGSVAIKIPVDLIYRFDSLAKKAGSREPLKKELRGIFTIIKKQVRESVIRKRDFTVPAEKPHYHAQRIQRAVEYINQHYTEDITLNDIAAQARLQPNYFGILFRQFTGSTFVQYLTGTRLEAALKMFNETNLTISEIAFQCGFDDPHYFSRVFSKCSGISPRELRKKF